MKSKQEFCAGGCVFKKDPASDEIKWLIGKHSGYNKWVLPKGMIEVGETAAVTAVREVNEETGVVAKIVRSEPIHIEKYSYTAILKTAQDVGQAQEPQRRVAIYQENPEFETLADEKILIHKTVTFFLMAHQSGDPSQHDWEMADAGWYSVDEALKLLAFEGEKKALEKAHQLVLQEKH